MDVQFVHERLDLELKQIRLIEILPDLRNGLIQARLSLAELTAAQTPDYRALSYTWGPERPTKTILMNGCLFNIRQNLHKFLETFRARLQAYSGNAEYAPEVQHLWIDQLCIDQNTTEERNHQVQMMAEIYQKATYVYLWLGNSDLRMHAAMTIIKLQYRQRHWGQAGKGSPIIENPTESAELEHLSNSLGDESLKGAALHTFFSQPYWSRTWIVQEVMLARYIRIFCGDEVLSWDELRRFCLTNPTSTPSRVKFLVENANALRVFDYAELLSIFADSGCSNRHDRVYGMLGLVDPSLRIPVNYEEPASVAYIHVGRAMVLKRCMTLPSLWSVQQWKDGFPDMHAEVSESWRHLGNTLQEVLEWKHWTSQNFATIGANFAWKENSLFSDHSILSKLGVMLELARMALVFFWIEPRNSPSRNYLNDLKQLELKESTWKRLHAVYEPYGPLSPDLALLSFQSIKDPEGSRSYDKYNKIYGIVDYAVERLICWKDGNQGAASSNAQNLAIVDGIYVKLPSTASADVVQLHSMDEARFRELLKLFCVENSSE